MPEHSKIINYLKERDSRLAAMMTCSMPPSWLNQKIIRLRQDGHISQQYSTSTYITEVKVNAV